MMVDLVLLQSVSYIAGALGVCVAAAYYVMNLGETRKNRRVVMTSSLIQPFTSLESGKVFIDLLSADWSDFDDFVKKYDSHVNPDYFAKRMSFWTLCDLIGYQFKSGLIDNETVYSVLRGYIVNGWLKFKPIIYEYRRRHEFPADAYDNFEYLANELSKMYKERDPSYKGAVSYFRPEEYDKAFSRK